MAHYNLQISWGTTVVSGILDASMTVNKGRDANTATVRLPPGTTFPRVVSLSWRANGIELFRMDNCAIQRAQLSQSGGYTVTLTIADRRWVWRDGKVSGHYNVKLPDGSIDPDTEKTPQELVDILLPQMGENDSAHSTFPSLISALPNESRPYVKWDYANPSDALEKLCDDLGCDIVPDFINPRIQIVERGSGVTLPVSPAPISTGAGIAGSAWPGSVVAVGAPIEFQARFLLEAVGLDRTDDTYKPLAQLPYYPTGGFALWRTFADVDDEDDRKVAQRHVYRSYRIKNFAEGGLTLPVLAIALNSVDEIVLFDGLMETEIIGTQKRRKRPEIRGTYFDMDSDCLVYSDKPYEGDFSVSAKRQMIRFNDRVFTMTANTPAPAEMYLDIAFTATDPDQQFVGLPIVYAKAEAVSGADGPTARLIRDRDLKRTIRVPYTALTTPGTPVDNVTEVDTRCQELIDAEMAEIQLDSSNEAVYPGLVAMELDGAIDTISWNVGGSGATTTIQRSVDSLALFTLESRRRRRKEREAQRTLVDNGSQTE